VDKDKDGHFTKGFQQEKNMILQVNIAERMCEQKLSRR